ncbi:hypothetical protein [Nocardia sp. NPDC004260]
MGITDDVTFDGPAPYPQKQVIYPDNGHYSLLHQFGDEVLASAARDSWG